MTTPLELGASYVFPVGVNTLVEILPLASLGSWLYQTIDSSSKLLYGSKRKVVSSIMENIPMFAGTVRNCKAALAESVHSRKSDIIAARAIMAP